MLKNALVQYRYRYTVKCVTCMMKGLVNYRTSLITRARLKAKAKPCNCKAKGPVHINTEIHQIAPEYTEMQPEDTEKKQVFHNFHF